jgi:hypothetical protein
MQLSERYLRAFARAPLTTRVTALAKLVVNGEQAIVAVSRLIDLITLMGSMLSAEARLLIAHQLIETASLLVPPRDRRLH